MAPTLSLRETRFFVRNVRTRMPFQYGAATLTSVPILHVQGQVETGDGARAEAWAADILPPKWFDKDPAKEYSDNVADLVAGARAAAAAYVEASRQPGTVFGIWREASTRCQVEGEAAGRNHLTSGHGSSLMERLLIDGLGRALGRPYHDLVRADLLGLDFGCLLPELAGAPPAAAIAPHPLDQLYVRHTVGLADPVRSADIPPDERLADGLPQSLEEYVLVQGIQYVKIKVGGDHRADIERLSLIASVLDNSGADYRATLDGNEQYRDMEGFHALLHALSSEPRLGSLYERILYIEQPLERSLALDPGQEPGIRLAAEHRPMLIDESDGDLDCFRRAVDLGYTGVSSKNCKGLIKALANQALARHLTTAGKGPYFLSGEDLMNLPVVPLHQDLAHLACLGISHAERNGHHYVRGLDHLTPSERGACLEWHGDLYEGTAEAANLAVRDGRIRLPSLQCPGLGVAVEVDAGAMTPLDDWRFESLA